MEIVDRVKNAHLPPTIPPAMGPALDDFCDTEVGDDEEVVRGTVACPLGTNEDVVLVVNTEVVESVSVAEEMEVVNEVIIEVVDVEPHRSVWALST
jgi:hypothetical protein